ncbi:MAG: TOBE domain-containing protein, partial [Betaproteobacteria bacterium]
GDFDGRIVSVFFLGSLTRVIVELGDAQNVVVETAERREYRKGEATGIRVDPGSVMTLVR